MIERCFAFISDSANILSELLKLNGLDFNGKQLMIKSAATISPAKSIESSKMETEDLLW